VYELKQQLQRTHAADAPLANFTRWVYKGRVLEDGSSLGFCEVKSGDCIIGIKTNVATKQDPAAAAAASSSSSAATNSPTSTVATPLFDSAMHEMLAHNGENLSGVQACIGTLVKICENIITQPMAEKFRRVPSNNTTFKARVGQLQGGASAMRGLGFMLNDATADWTLVPSTEAWENLVACFGKMSRFQRRLTQEAPGAGGSAGAGVGTSAAEGGVVTGSTGSSSTSSGSSGAGSASTTEKVSSDEAAAPPTPATGASANQTAQQMLLLAMALAAKVREDKDNDTGNDGRAGAAAKDSSA